MEWFELDAMGLAVRFVLGALIGFCIGLTGVGGGVLALPALTLLLRMDSVMAVGTASLYSFLTKASALFHHIQLKTIDWTTSLWILSGALPANLFVAYRVAGRGGDKEFDVLLQKVIVGVILFSVGLMIYNLIEQIRHHQSGGSKRKISDHIAGKPVLRRILAVSVGGVLGALIGSTSIGGGILLVALLMILFGLNARKTVGSAIFISVILTLFTSLSYFSGENSMDAVTAVVMVAGSLIGVSFGSKLSVRMPEKFLQGVMIILIFISAILMICKQGH